MYKIVFVVAVFAFVLQGALSSPVAANNEAMPTFLKSDGSKNVGPAENKAANADPAETTTTTVDVTTTTGAPKSGASSTEMCLLLVQVSSLALVAKHMLL